MKAKEAFAADANQNPLKNSQALSISPSVLVFHSKKSNQAKTSTKIPPS
jgi:hypothetical protein